MFGIRPCAAGILTAQGPAVLHQVGDVGINTIGELDDAQEQVLRRLFTAGAGVDDWAEGGRNVLALDQGGRIRDGCDVQNVQNGKAECPDDATDCIIRLLFTLFRNQVEQLVGNQTKELPMSLRRQGGREKDRQEQGTDGDTSVGTAD